jgi:uncharacterized LabA/DUF88 family protein
LAGLYDRPFLFVQSASTPPAIAPPRPRTNVYIDGFNFYYGAVKDTPHKWLDFEKFISRLRPSDDILRIYYFTSLVTGSHRTRQQTYLNALSTFPKIEIVLGKFLEKQIKCRVSACTATCSRVFKTNEEKRTDVNIAVYMLDHAYQNECDHFVLVSGDSDLVPAIQRIKQRFPKKTITVYVPSRGRPGHAIELRSSADRQRDVPLNLLPIAQLPTRVPNSAGGFYQKPAEW